MKIKDYLIATGISTTVSLVVVFILWLMSLISWAIVWATLSFGFIPVVIKASEIEKEMITTDRAELAAMLARKKIEQ